MINITFFFFAFFSVLLGVFVGFALRVYKENGSKHYFSVLGYSLAEMIFSTIIMFFVAPIVFFAVRKSLSKIVADAIIRDSKRPLLDREKKSLYADMYKYLNFGRRFRLVFYVLGDFISGFDVFGVECISRGIKRKQVTVSNRSKNKHKNTLIYEYKESVRSSISRIHAKKGSTLFPCTA